VLLATAVAVGVLAGPVVLAVGLVVIAAVLVVWRRVRPAGFEATAGRVLLGSGARRGPTVPAGAPP
jgi:hypothetical protein